MKKHLVYIIGLFLGVGASAQEFNLPIQNQYITDNPFLISAAYAGIGDCWQIRGTGFEQWVGIDDAPSTQTISVDGRLADRSGIGLVLFNDKNGATSQRGAQASFAHHLVLSEYSRQYLSFGISYKFTQFNIDSSNFNRVVDITGSNQDLNTTDNNFDVSVLYRLKSFFLSLNAINLLNKPLAEFDPTEPGNLTNYYVYSGFTFENIFKKLQFEPSVLYRNYSSDTRSTIDLNFKVRKFFRDSYIWGGVSARSLLDQEFKPVSVSPMVGIKKSKFYFAYGYVINTNEVLETSNNGSHLLTIGIDFACKKSNCGCTY